ncbi:hypothetical protein [Chryseolinea lacunae]|uniref:Uncharacterized protein n=1 Tax=Chryseolinea lacunae TaxID=2801331 RepID=A0ABS1KWR4_9BACT|nr:hypothetical protein [Chryseolinea lacunae]MBL0743890.1 hypothetical protein [Chryseolinea lacunae]
MAIRVRGTNGIPIVKADGHQILLEPSLVPGYPVIVVKTNERMITEKQPGFRETESTRTIKGANGLSYKFTDDLFDRSLTGLAYREEKQKRLIKPDAKLKAAYDIYKKADGWQRDYIYYGITPSAPDGEFSYDYKEYISSFYVTGDAFLVHQRMAEQSGDPFIKSGKKSSGWTDGFFEIRCTAAVHGQNGVGTEIKSAFLSKGSNLFDVVYHVKKKGIWPFRYDFYEIESVTAKQVLTSMPLVNWDLESYASTFRIDVEEADNVEVIKTSRTENVEFATNFDVQATILKVGLKFGASRKRNVTNTIEVTTTLESDYLGQATVNFADKVITEKSVFGLYMSREYYNDIFSISIEPRHIQ